MLRALPAQLGAAIAAQPDDAVFRRLFPPADADDPLAEEEFRQMVRPDLDENRAQALDTLAKTAMPPSSPRKSSTPGCGLSITSGCGSGPCSASARRTRASHVPEELPAHLLYYLLTAWQELVVSVLSEP